MPTSAVYKQLSEHLRQRRVPLWAFFSIGIALLLVGLLFYETDSDSLPQIITRLGMLLGLELTMISWILICICFWFQEREPILFTNKVGEKYPRLFEVRNRLRSGLEWYASLVLTFWFAACVVAGLSLLWSQILKPLFN